MVLVVVLHNVLENKVHLKARLVIFKSTITQSFRTSCFYRNIVKIKLSVMTKCNKANLSFSFQCLICTWLVVFGLCFYWYGLILFSLHKL